MANYDYQKAHDKVRHDWMVSVYGRMGIADEIFNMITEMIKRWKTTLKVQRNGKKDQIT